MVNPAEVIIFDDDSIASDFFDDFSNQDFMAGLDVVDAWDEEEDEEGEVQDEGEVEGEVRVTQALEEAVEPTAKKKNNDASKKTRHHKRIKIRAKRSRSRSANAHHKRNKSEYDNRLKRDPEKSKRDIQRDKDKWTKNNEAKIISERLKMVETGLVPPGTEMEVDLKEMKSSVNLPDLREKLRKKSRSSSFDLSTRLTHRKRSRDRRRSPVNRRSRTRSRSTSRSRRRISPRNHNSRVSLRSTSLTRRYLSPRSNKYHGTSPPPRRQKSPGILDHKSVRYGHSRSPGFVKRDSRRHSRPRSQSRSVSEREYWIRNRSYRPKRDSSPSKTDERRKPAPKDFLEELADKLKYDEKKKKILQEISHKLNEPTHSNIENQMYHSTPAIGISHGSGPGLGPGLMPAPVPGPVLMGPPNHFVQDPGSQYDQAFFIGGPSNPNGFPPNNFEPILVPPVVPALISYPIPANRQLISVNKSEEHHQDSSPVSSNSEEDKKAASKLLEDKTITLSEYLAMTAKYHADNSKTVNIHKKVKVLARCQDALKALGNTEKLNGRLYLVQSSINCEKPNTTKCLSSLRKIPVTRFGFTTPWRSSDEKVGPQSSLQKLMISLSLPFKNEVGDSKGSSIKNSTSKRGRPALVTVTTSTPPPASVVPTPPPAPKIHRKPSPLVGVRFQSKLCQTDVDKCEKCEKHKAIKYNQCGIQCNSSTVDFGTQITEEDVRRFDLKQSAVGVAKKSFALQTTAELLAGGEPAQRRGLFPSSHKITPTHTNISPESLRMDYSQNGANMSRLSNILESNMKTFDTPSRFENNYRDVRVSGLSRMPEERSRMQLPYFEQSEEHVRMQERLMLEEHMRKQTYFAQTERLDNFPRGNFF